MTLCRAHESLVERASAEQKAVDGTIRGRVDSKIVRWSITSSTKIKQCHRVATRRVANALRQTRANASH